MNKLELAQRIHDEVTSYTAQNNAITTTVLGGLARPQQRAIVSWLDATNLEIQRERLWNFRKTEGKLFDAVIGTSDYTLSTTIEEFDPWGFTTIEPGGTDKIWLEWMDFPTWIDVFNSTFEQLGNSWPRFITQLPTMELRLTPPPSKAYEIHGVWYPPAVEMTDDTDVPEWHADYHELLVWRTVQKFIGELGVSKKLAERVEPLVAQWDQRFRNRYL